MDSPWVRNLLAQDVGGAFENVKQWYGEPGTRSAGMPTEPSLSLTVPASLQRTFSYNGPIFARSGIVSPSSSVWPVVDTVALSQEMTYYGAVAISRTIPTNPAVGVGQLIGESLDRLPSLPGAAILGRPGRARKKFADEYLNLEFGLKPLISDVTGMLHTAQQQDKLLKQLERDSGRLVRRQYRFPEEVTHTRVTAGVAGTRQPYPPISTQFYNGGVSSGEYQLHRKTVKRMWFSGAYTYHYETGKSIRDRMVRAEQQANRLYGLRLDPNLVWELSPWSWAADWVSNTGSVLTNLSAFARDGLVLRWGYLMCHLTVTETHTTRANLKAGDRVLTQSFTTEVKKRVKATPYGFGLDPDWRDFSDRQLAILASLGISRGS